MVGVFYLDIQSDVVGHCPVHHFGEEGEMFTLAVIELLDVAGGEVADLALAVGCAVHGGIVNDHVVPVGRFLNVELDAIGAYLVAFANTGNAT